MTWTDERVEALKKLWAEGLSASQIASRLGEVTRNAVIGKVHRLGLSGRTTTSRVKSVRPRRSVARTKRQRLLRFQPQSPGRDLLPLPLDADGAVFREVEELVIPVEERKSIQSLVESSCRWPIGDPQHEDFHFCGRDRMTGLPYCEFHARRAFQPAQPRRREQKPLPQIRTA
ncbi:MAG: GcrA family cell cycle regulator [Hyphomicrobiaceae bacterium]